ncbi:hypothetical protein QL285_022613 [Trifolium repens]|nr:hypothetical protein QL285_022613 [Trifolium repens]
MLEQTLIKTLVFLSLSATENQKTTLKPVLAHPAQILVHFAKRAEKQTALQGFCANCSQFHVFWSLFSRQYHDYGMTSEPVSRRVIIHTLGV